MGNFYTRGCLTIVHYIIRFLLQNKTCHIEDSSSRESSPRFFWDHLSKVKFEEVLKSHSTKTFLDELSNNKDISPDRILSQLTEKILTCAGECGLNTSRKRTKEKTANSPWFDKECGKLKK